MLLKIENLTKQYKGKYGIEGLNLTLSEGEVAALLGPNGAGKTTAMKAITGMIPADKGEASYKGISIFHNPELTKKGIGMMIGEPSPYLYLTARQYLMMYSNLYSKVNADDIDEVLGLTGLSNRGDSRIRTFSTGMKQRVCLARVLLAKPELILLDEPFSGMDIEGRSQMVLLLKKIAEEKKTAMIISSHLIHDIEQLTSKVCIVNDGKWLETRTVHEIKADYGTIEEYYLDLMSKRSDKRWVC